jgi:DNA-binding Lrp family transcriptional regulator
MALAIKESREKFIVEISKKIPRELIQDFLKRIEIEEIASQIEISEEEINKLADEVKKEWWEKEGILVFNNLKFHLIGVVLLGLLFFSQKI